MATSRDADIAEHGFTAVPGSADVLFSKRTLKPAQPLAVNDIFLPKSQTIEAVTKEAQEALPKETFHHSMRVFYFGEAIRKQYFPEWKFSSETYLLTCLLHDIGTAPKHIDATLMSFEYYGGMIAHKLVSDNSASVSQAEAVAEAIIRHQDISQGGVDAAEGTIARGGQLTALGQLIQLATIFDNMGGHAELVHRDTIENVVAAWPRLGWSGCFARTIRFEDSLKPWAHTTKLGEREFPEGVENNKLMEPYDKS